MANLVAVALGGILGVGGIATAVAVPTLFSGGGTTEPTVWRVKDRDSFPLLTCKNEKSKILISLKSKNNSRALKEKDELTFTGYEEHSRKIVDLLENTREDGSAFQLTIWKESGNSRLGELGGSDSHNYGMDLFCGTNHPFKVIKYRTTTGIGEYWEKGFDKIKLTLDKCQAKNGQQVCEIKIDNSAEITWKPEFTPTVIL